MAPAQILKAAITKATEGGWASHNLLRANRIDVFELRPEGGAGISDVVRVAPIWTREVESIIFNHEYAQAIWGEGWHFNVGENRMGNKCHLCGGSCPWFRVEPNEFARRWMVRLLGLQRALATDVTDLPRIPAVGVVLSTTTSNSQRGDEWLRQVAVRTSGSRVGHIGSRRLQLQ